MNQLQEQFPLLEPELEQTLSEEPIFLDGMKVLFDVNVGLYPVQLTKKEKKGKPQNDPVDR